MVLIFDLDDTLYDERAYVESGLRSVAAFGRALFGWDLDASFHFMLDVLDREGRGAIFDRWLESRGRYSRSLVHKCVRAYRHHTPHLSLYPDARDLLPKLKGHPLYVVTDGHKIVQQHKIEALAIAPLFRRIFITHRYGIQYAKPSTYCFERIREAERCDWADMTYVGDDPAKDFVGLREVRMNTVRVLTGAHRNAEAKPGYEARYCIPDLGHFMSVIGALSADPAAG